MRKRKTIPCAQCQRPIKVGEWCLFDNCEFGMQLETLEADFYGFTVPDYDPTAEGYNNNETLLIHVDCTQSYFKTQIAEEEECMRLGKVANLRPLEEISDEELIRVGFDPADIARYRKGDASPDHIKVLIPGGSVFLVPKEVN